MVVRLPDTLAELYESDETAWLECMAARIAAGCLEDLDYAHLTEYLTDMAQRDRREVVSRLTVLLTHMLKWIHQPDHRSGSWRSTISAQRDELADLLQAAVLRKHALAVLGTAYARAVDRAADETGLAKSVFPCESPFSLDQLLEPNLTANL